MTRLLSLGLLSLLIVTPARAAEELAGTWRQETEGIGVSYWELTSKGENTYEAQEYGLGGAKGTARLEDDRLVIRFETADGGKGSYVWLIKKRVGKGKLVFTPAGGETKESDNSSVRFIGK
jgi:hypothetical protein